MSINAQHVSPSITCDDLQKSIEFYQALGFEVGETHEHEGKVAFAMMKGGNGEIGLGQDDFAKGRDRKKGIGMRLWVGTKDDLNEIVKRFKAAGFTPDSEVQALPWGPLAFAVTDPDGFMLTISNG